MLHWLFCFFFYSIPNLGPPGQVAAVSGKKAGMAQGELGGILKELGYTEDQVSSPKISLIVIDITCTRFSSSEGNKDSIVG